MIKRLGDFGSRLFQQDGWFIFVLIFLNLPMFLQNVFKLPLDEWIRADLKVFYSGAFFIVVFSALLHFLLK